MALVGLKNGILENSIFLTGSCFTSLLYAHKVILSKRKEEKPIARKKTESPFDPVAYAKTYQKENVTRVSVVLNKRTDTDIIEHLEKKRSKSEYIKRLIREDIADPAADRDQAHADPDAGSGSDPDQE